jgi:hypothetical protein
MANFEKNAIEAGRHVAAPRGARRQRVERAAETGRVPAWLWPNLLSLDAPLVAAAWELLLARCYHVPAPLATTLVLALAVWVIYIGDRMLDAVRLASTEGLPARHRFYRAHWRALLLPAVVAAPLGAWLAVTRLDAAVFLNGVILLAAIGAYFGLVHLLPRRQWFPKELAVAAVFAAGCFLPAWRGAGLPGPGVAVPALLFAAVCWINLAIIEHTEWARLRDRQWDAPHRSTALVGRHAVVASAGAALLGLLLMMLPALGAAPMVLAAVALGAAGLAALGARKDKLTADAVRVWADAVLLAPLLLLPFVR